jgi:hypothetical protein
MNTKDSVSTRGNVGIIIYNGRNLPTFENNATSVNKIVFSTYTHNEINNLCKWYASDS